MLRSLSCSALLLMAIAACGEPSPAAPVGRLAVLQRGLAWERLRGQGSDQPASALTLAWTAEAGLDQWTSPDGPLPSPVAGVLHVDLEAPGQAGSANGSANGSETGKENGAALQAPGLRLDGPTDTPFDPILHHWLTLRGTTATPLTLRVHWRSRDEAFSEERASAPMSLPASPEPQTWSLPLTTLRAAREAADVSEGVDQFRLVFRAPAGSEGNALDLESVVLSSDFDAPGDGALPQHRRGVAGVLRDGVALRLPGTLVAEVTPGPHDRLRLGLALAGSAVPVDVTLRDEGGTLEPHTVRCEPGAEWLDVALDLAPLHGRKARLMLEAKDAPTPFATVLVGGVMRLGPDGRDLPDVVFYVEDTLRADHLGTYGHSVATDPHLQRIAQDGAVFEHAFSASSWTRPSVSTIHTSLDPIAHGNLTFGDRVAEPVQTLAETLADAGYLTASFITNYHGGGWSGLDQGFDEAHEPTAHGSTRVTTTLTSAAVAGPIDRFLQEHEGERVYVFVQSLDPHTPYEPIGADHYALQRGMPAAPEDPVERERADLALRYDAEILHNDRLLQRLDDTLEATGRAANTLFLFASDHGEAFGEHGQMEHRKTLHQEELHVPWVVRWPGVVAPGTRLDAWVGHVDMAPTLLGLLKLDAPESWMGRNLSPLLRDGTGTSGTTAPDLTHPLLVHMVHEDEVQQSIAVLRAPFKLIMPLDASGEPVGPARLLDLEADPEERVDLIRGEATGDGTGSLTSSQAATIATAMEQWARRTLLESRAISVPGEAQPMDPAMRDWMREMGYLK